MNKRLIAFFAILIIFISACSTNDINSIENQVQNRKEETINYQDGALLFYLDEDICRSKSIKLIFVDRGEIHGMYESYPYIDVFFKECDPFSIIDLRIPEQPTNFKIRFCERIGNNYNGNCDELLYQINKEKSDFIVTELECVDCDKKLNIVKDVIWCNEKNLEFTKPNSYTLKFFCEGKEPEILEQEEEKVSTNPQCVEKAKSLIGTKAIIRFGKHTNNEILNSNAEPNSIAIDFPEMSSELESYRRFAVSSAQELRYGKEVGENIQWIYGFYELSNKYQKTIIDNDIIKGDIYFRYFLRIPEVEKLFEKYNKTDSPGDGFNIEFDITEYIEIPKCNLSLILT